MHAIHLMRRSQINFPSQWLIAFPAPGATEGAWNATESRMGRGSALLNVESIVQLLSASSSTSVTFDVVVSSPSWNFLLSPFWRHYSCCEYSRCLWPVPSPVSFITFPLGVVMWCTSDQSDMVRYVKWSLCVNVPALRKQLSIIFLIPSSKMWITD